MTARPKPKAPTGLRFYPASHRYKLDGQWVPGVTTILGVLDKPAIPKWAARQVAEYVADNIDGVETLRAMGRASMVEALRNIPWQKRDDAADRGSSIHDYAEAILHGHEIEVEEHLAPVVENAIRFMDDWQIKPLLIERPVASREHQWAGTFDLIANYVHPVTGDRGTAIFDWKSGKALYPEFAWQLNAYAHAEFYTDDEGTEHSLPATGAAYGVHIRDDDYDVAPFTFGPHIYDEFVAIRRVYDIARRGRGNWKRPGSGYVGLTIQPPAKEHTSV